MKVQIRGVWCTILMQPDSKLGSHALKTLLTPWLADIASTAVVLPRYHASLYPA
jgi:hypothetical protein